MSKDREAKSLSQKDFQQVVQSSGFQARHEAAMNELSAGDFVRAEQLDSAIAQGVKEIIKENSR